MDKLTKNISFYILTFFIGLFVLMVIYFIYKTYLAPQPNLDPNILGIDEEYKKILAEAEKIRLEKEKKEKKYKDYTEKPCFIAEKEYPDGSAKKFYSVVEVSPNQSCEKYALTRYCDNGFWLGDKNFKYAECQEKVDCQITDDFILKNNESIMMYSQAEVPYGQKCSDFQEKRKCIKTLLTGDPRFKFLNCQVSTKNACKRIDENGQERIIPDGKLTVFYSQTKVKYNDLCQNYAQARICSKGVLSGDNKFKFFTCQKEKPKDCQIDDIIIKHNGATTLYSRQSYNNLKPCIFYSQIRKCTNGVLDGNPEFKYSKCQDREN